MNHKKLLKKIWTSVYDPNADTAEIIKCFFHPDYEQCINGVVMRREEYTRHVIAQKTNMTVESIHYRHMLEMGDELFSVYYPEGKNTEGKPVKAEVIAYIRFENEQIIEIHGQVRMLDGKPSDADM